MTKINRPGGPHGEPRLHSRPYAAALRCRGWPAGTSVDRPRHSCAERPASATTHSRCRWSQRASRERGCLLSIGRPPIQSGVKAHSFSRVAASRRVASRRVASRRVASRRFASVTRRVVGRFALPHLASPCLALSRLASRGSRDLVSRLEIWRRVASPPKRGSKHAHLFLSASSYTSSSS